ncbi:hypothetical protein Tco_1108881 [Tanacetum coccineum]
MLILSRSRSEAAMRTLRRILMTILLMEVIDGDVEMDIEEDEDETMESRMMRWMEDVDMDFRDSRGWQGGAPSSCLPVPAWSDLRLPDYLLYLPTSVHLISPMSYFTTQISFPTITTPLVLTSTTP